MFIPVWLIFLFTGTVMAVAFLVWSIRSHQYDDQDRARYLPLNTLEPEELADQPPVRHGAGFYGILTILILGIGSVLLTLLVVLKHI